ncbi:MAG: DUF5915 domain-containing protein, partial [Bacteroidota bacterium]
KHMKFAAQAIAKFTQEDIADLEKTGSYQLQVEDDRYDLTLEDFEITTDDIPGWAVANDGPLTVALDVTLTEDLKAEGMARELVNRIQNIRKAKDLNVTDKIMVQLENHEAVRNAVTDYGDYICSETLAKKLELVAEPAGEKVELVDEVEVAILVNLA